VSADLPEEEQEEKLKELEDKDAQVEQFRALSEDKAVAPLETAWLVKLAGDPQPYNQPPPKEGTASYAVAVLKSLRWPGAVTVAQVREDVLKGIEWAVLEPLYWIRAEERGCVLQPN